jgi:hypothetical protein
MTKIDKDSISAEIKLRCVEIAERTVASPYVPSSDPGRYGGSYKDKPMREILERADRIAMYCFNEDIPLNLVERLRSALCEKS